MEEYNVLDINQFTDKFTEDDLQQFVDQYIKYVNFSYFKYPLDFSGQVQLYLDALTAGLITGIIIGYGKVRAVGDEQYGLVNTIKLWPIIDFLSDHDGKFNKNLSGLVKKYGKDADEIFYTALFKVGQKAAYIRKKLYTDIIVSNKKVSIEELTYFAHEHMQSKIDHHELTLLFKLDGDMNTDEQQQLYQLGVFEGIINGLYMCK